MGKTADLTVAQKTIIDPFTRRVSHKHSLPKKLAVHRVLYPSMLTESWVEGKSVEEKDAQPTERTAALWGLSRKIDSRIWVNFTRNGLRLGSRHQESPHSRAVVLESGLGLETFFYRLGLVLDSLVFGLGLFLGLGHWTRQMFKMVSTESSNICFFFSFKTKTRLFRKWVM